MFFLLLSRVMGFILWTVRQSDNVMLRLCWMEVPEKRIFEFFPKSQEPNQKFFESICNLFLKHHSSFPPPSSWLRLHLQRNSLLLCSLGNHQHEVAEKHQQCWEHYHMQTTETRYHHCTPFSHSRKRSCPEDAPKTCESVNQFSRPEWRS